MMFRRIQHVHFVGIGGIGMCGIAELLAGQGYRVTGSDLKEGPTVARLRSLGVEVSVGHASQHVGDADVVVYSSAVRPQNPELVEAERRKIPVIPRAEMLAELMRLKDGVAVGGSHGKTTTTSLIAHVLHVAGLDPTAVIGGRVLLDVGTHGRASRRGLAARRRGRRERRVVPAPGADHRSGHQHRPRAPRPLRERRRAARGVRGVREPGAVLGSLGAVPRPPRRAGAAAAHDPAHDDLRLLAAGRPASPANSNSMPAAPRSRCDGAASRSAARACRWPASTTCRTRSRRSPSRSNSTSPSTRDRGPRDLPGHRAPLRAQGRGARRARGRRLRPSPRRDPRDARRRAAGPRRPRRGGVPAASLLAHASCSSRISSPRSIRPTCWSSPRSMRRARTRSRASRARGSPTRSAPTVSATCVSSPTSTPCRRRSFPISRPATSSSRSAPATSLRWVRNSCRLWERRRNDHGGGAHGAPEADGRARALQCAAGPLHVARRRRTGRRAGRFPRRSRRSRRW